MTKTVLLFLLFASSSAYALTDREVESMLQKDIQSMRSEFPLRIDKTTSVITIMAGPGRRVTYISITDIAASSWTPAMRAHSKRFAINDYCTNPSMKAYLSFSVTVEWQFSDREGRHILTNIASPNDCR